MEIGGVNPFGLDGDFPLLIDAAVMGRPEVLLGAGVRTAKIFAHPRLLELLPNASVTEGLAYSTGAAGR